MTAQKTTLPWGLGSESGSEVVCPMRTRFSRLRKEFLLLVSLSAARKSFIQWRTRFSTARRAKLPGGFGALGSEHGSEFDCPMENEISGGSESDPPGGLGRPGAERFRARFGS